MIQSDPEEPYARSDGWVAQVDPRLEEVGRVFTWRDVLWEVSAHFPTPCCGERLALVRRVVGGCESWQGISCPNACDDSTWAVEWAPQNAPPF